VGGVRFELAELRESALPTPGVAEVAFEIRRGDVDQVVAFVVPVDPELDRTALATALRRQVASAVPAAVAPSEVLVVRELVFNAHGKFDVGATRALAEGAR
jgi:acyl-coenzyme A synthetase/AMP-(fatty) acid ligase